MSSKAEKQVGLPEIYLSPSCHPGQGHGAHTSSDTELNAWEDTDNEAWTALVPELTLGAASGAASVLGLREEIEGGSSLDIPLGGTSPEKEIENNSEKTQNAEALVIQPKECEVKTLLGSNRGQVPRQRGETPGSDCPPVAGITAFVRRLGQPLNLDTETQTTRSSELIFSPGGDQGFIVPRGVHAYYGSDSDTETLEWADGGGGPTLVPIRDAVEGADAVPPPDRAMESSVEGLERNSPAGLSTPDAEIDLAITTGRTAVSKEPQEAIRPPAVGQSEEVLMQSSRKDLGSTDGEESEEESRKRISVPQEAVASVSGSAEVHLGSLGSQSENTDSVSTVLDMRRGEVQGCERDFVSNTAVASPILGVEAQPKPAFVVGGLISPRGKLRQFQDAVRDRMLNVKASLDLGSGATDEPGDRQHYLSQLPLYPPLTPTNEPEASLASLVSMESTNPPESSDRVTSPSVLSVSSVASSKRMEWDSGADVGYLGTNTPVTPAASLSTLERIALGSYASVLRTEPEGTTQAKEKQKVSKKGGKSVSIKGNNQGANGRSSAADPAVAFPLSSARIHLNREKVCWSSSEEDSYTKLPSPAQSPRRRLRRRALMASPRDGDSSARKSAKATHILDRRLKEITQGRRSEGKSSSLVELATPAINSFQYRRSNSQQSLHVAPSLARSAVQGASEMDATGVVDLIKPNKKGEQLVANTSTSTSTLVQSMSPLPVLGSGASTSTSAVIPGALQQVPGGKEGHVPVTGDSRCSSMSSLTVHDRESLQHLHGKPSWTSSGNDISSRSEASSPALLPSHTDTESLTSRPFTTEPGDLKARKNSENEKNHNTARKGSGSDLEVRGGRAESNLPSPGDMADPQNGALDNESPLESQVSLQSFNNALHALSVKLQEHIQALLDNGSLRKVQDYNKLQDYVRFVGIPSATEEECRLRQGVAGVITRMFGEIAFDHPQVTTDTSNTFTSETSDSHVGDQQLHTPGNCEDLDVPAPWCDSGGEKEEQEHDGREKGQQNSRRKQEKQLCSREQEQQGDGKEQDKATAEQDRCTTPGGTVLIVPYRPPSASRTYFMAVSHEWESGLVEGEHVPTHSDVSTSRGQAEGERLEGTGAVPVTSRLHQTPSESGSNNEWDSAKVLNEVETTLRERDEEALPSLPSDHQFLERSQGTGTPQSESSPDHSSSPLLHTWPKEEPTSSQWWAKGGRCERLYQDRRGGLHVAHQPPGYTDDHDDSHPSESLSDHDHRLRCLSEDAGRPTARPWTSSGSESAYETIRERHRHVDEALASSFEFYSTSPRDARLLGYVSSEGQEEEEQQSIESPIPTPNPAVCDSAVHSSSLRHLWHQQKQQHHHQQQDQEQLKHQQEHQQQQQLQQTESQISSPSSHTGNTHDVSSQISFIQHQKQKYVRKIQRHIQTLEKLERALLDQLGDSIGSEGPFRQRVTEGCSHTESNTSGNARTHTNVDRSDTSMSSIKSSEENNGSAKKQRNQTHNLGMVGLKSSHVSGQESPLSNDGNGEDIRLSFGPSGTGQSYSSSPRINISQRSSDINSSRASTMRQVEEEVKKLATAEEQSRQVVLRPHSSSCSRDSHIHQRRRQHGKESRRDEDSARFELMSSSVQDNTPEGTTPGRMRPSTASEVPAIRKVPADSSSSELQSAQAHPISEESSSDLPASESQISRQGDGRESKGRKQTGKAGSVTSISNKALILKPPAAAGVNISELSSVHSRTILFRDFGQMFPSTECILLGSGGKGESVGVQTSNSLLYSRKGSKKRGDSMSISTSDKESMAGSLRNKKAWNKGKQDTTSNEDVNNAEKHIAKFGHKRTSDMKKRYLNKKHFQKETPKLDNLRKDKVSVKEKRKTRESNYNSLKEGSTNNKEKNETVKNKHLPKKTLKLVSKSERKRSAGTENRTTVFSDKCSAPQDRELSSRLTSESEARTISSGSSLSLSIQSTSHLSSEHDRMSSSKVESIQTEEKQSEYSEGDNSITECSKELEHHSQLDVLSANEDPTNQGYQSQSREQCIASYDQCNIKECVEGLKGGAEDSLTVKTPGQLLCPAQENGISRQMGISESNSNAKHKLTLVASLTKKENIKNKSNVVQHFMEEERHPVVTIQGLDSKRQEQKDMSGTLKVAWMEDNEKEKVPEKKLPVRFEVKFSKQKNFNPRKSKFPTTTTTNVIQEELRHTTKAITLQEALARARPDYLREAGDRSALIRLKREMRQAAQTHNHNVLAQIPSNLQTPTTLQRFMYKPDLAPLFSYKDIRQQNQRLYSLLPEARAPGAKHHQAAVLRTNRLLASLYSQRLRKKVMQGQVSHAHKEVVTPLVHRVLHK